MATCDNIPNAPASLQSEIQSTEDLENLISDMESFMSDSESCRNCINGLADSLSESALDTLRSQMEVLEQATMDAFHSKFSEFDNTS